MSEHNALVTSDLATRLVGEANEGFDVPVSDEEQDRDRFDAVGLDWGEDGIPLGDQSAGIGPSSIEEGVR